MDRLARGDTNAEFGRVFAQGVPMSGLLFRFMYDGGVKSIAVYNDGKYDGVPKDIVGSITENELYEYACSEMNIIYPEKGSDFEIANYCLEEDGDGYYIAITGNMGNALECVRYQLEK